jgi:hypothetical protein
MQQSPLVPDPAAYLVLQQGGYQHRQHNQQGQPGQPFGRVEPHGRPPARRGPGPTVGPHRVPGPRAQLIEGLELEAHPVHDDDLRQGAIGGRDLRLVFQEPVDGLGHSQAVQDPLTSGATPTTAVWYSGLPFFSPGIHSPPQAPLGVDCTSDTQPLEPSSGERKIGF